MPPRRPPAPFNATKKDARDDTKAAVRAFKDHRRMMPTNPLGGIGRELDARMEKVGDGERYLDDATEAAQSNEDSAAEIVRNAEGVQDDVRLEPEKVGEDARTAKLVVDGELKESLEIVRSLIEAQPNLAGALQTIFPSGDQRAVDQYEPILERLGAAERHLEASEKDVARAAEQYSTEETSHKAAKRAYLDDREAWKRQRLELTAEVEGRKDEIEWMGRTIDDVKAESSTTKTILETERLQRTELEERVAAQEAKIKWLRDEFSKAKHDLEAERIKLNQSLAAQQTSLQQKDEEHAAQTSKLQDDLAATRLQLSDNAQVRHRQLARIRELEVAFVDDVASVDNELSMAKHQLEVNETERNRVQDKCDELERDLDDFRRHNGELQAKVSRRDGRLMQANDILGELQVFRDTVIGWHGLSGDDITNDLAQEFVEVANIASQMGDWPIMSHSLDGLQLTYAGDGPTTNYGLRKQMVRFWCQCRAGEVDYVAANNMLNARLSESVEWSAVPFLYKAFGILLGRWTQVSISSLDEVPGKFDTCNAYLAKLMFRRALCAFAAKRSAFHGNPWCLVSAGCPCRHDFAGVAPSGHTTSPRLVVHKSFQSNGSSHVGSKTISHGGTQPFDTSCNRSRCGQSTEGSPRFVEQ